MHNMLQATRNSLDLKMQRADVNVKIEISLIFLHMHELQSHYELQLIKASTPKFFKYTKSYNDAKEQIKGLLEPYPEVRCDFILSIGELEAVAFNYDHPEYPSICGKPDCLRSLPPA